MHPPPKCGSTQDARCTIRSGRATLVTDGKRHNTYNIYSRQYNITMSCLGRLRKNNNESESRWAIKYSVRRRAIWSRSMYVYKVCSTTEKVWKCMCVNRCVNRSVNVPPQNVCLSHFIYLYIYIYIYVCTYNSSATKNWPRPVFIVASYIEDRLKMSRTNQRAHLRLKILLKTVLKWKLIINTGPSM